MPQHRERSQRGTELHALADRQIGELLDLLSTLDAETLRRPCSRRGKLGDGTVAASARHTAENYGRIAAFLTANRQPPGTHAPPSSHSSPYTADNTNPAAVAVDLSHTRDAIARIAALTDRELDAIPAKGSFRFCDGQRTLEQVLAGLLTHQAHQLDAIKVAVSDAGRTAPR